MSLADVRMHAVRLGLASCGILALLITWQLAALASLLPPAIVPAPMTVLRRAWALLQDPYFLESAEATGYRWLVGFTAGGIVGFVGGVLIGATTWARLTFLSLVDFLRSIPVTIAFPAFLLAFGLSDAANIALAFAATVFLVTLNVALGVSQGSPQRAAFMRAMRASWLSRVYYLHIPEALAGLALGLRATLSLSLIVVLISEMFLGSRAGLGQLAYNAYLQNSPETVFAVILWVGAAGMFANRVFGFLSLRRLAE